MKDPEIRFCTSADGTRIAYALEGSGPPLLILPGWGSHIEHDWYCPDIGRVLDALTARCTILYLDKRGTGASDPEPAELSLSVLVQDVKAVVDSAGWDRFTILGMSDDCVTSLAYAAEYPNSVERMALWAPFANGSRVISADDLATMKALIKSNWGMARRAIAQTIFPSGPTELVLHTAEAFKGATTPEMFTRFLEYRASIDIDEALSKISQPTLVLHRRGDRNAPIKEGRALAAAMPNARFVALEGDQHPLTDPDDSVLPVLWEFFGFDDEGGETLPTGQATAIILFADIVDSTALTERLGDAAFRERARDLDGSLRTIIWSASGTPIEGKLLGDGVLATFASARQAIEAARRCGSAGDECGLPLHLGLHAGDVIREDDNIYGGAVNIAARIASESAPGEVLVSQTVRDLARTSAGVSFEDAGERALKGVGEPVRVWAVRECGAS